MKSVDFRPFSILLLDNVAKFAWSFYFTQCLKFKVFLIIFHISGTSVYFFRINILEPLGSRGGDSMYFEIKTASNSQVYFVIKASNHQVLATSETYMRRYDCEHAINLIKQGAATAPIKG